MNRRTFLGAAAASAAAPLFAAEPTKAPEKAAMLPVIDTHQHLWDLTKVKLNWLKKGSEFDQSFTPKEYAAAIEGLNVVKSIYMEVDVVAEQQKDEAAYVIELCEAAKTTMVAAVIAGHPADDGFPTYIAAYKNVKFVKGVRQVLHVDGTPAGTMLKDSFVKGVQLLGDLGLSFDLCLRPAELTEAAKLAEKCPDTRFILDHCGNPQAKFTKKEFETWKSDLAKLAEQKNVIAKISGIVANGWEKGKWTADDLAPAVNATIDAFGVKRCVYGGDWPVCTKAGTYGDWLKALRAILANRPEADQKAILHDNAVKYYAL